MNGAVPSMPSPVRLSSASEATCPVEAIDHEDNVPEEWQDYIPLNAEMVKTGPQILEKKPPLADCKSQE